MRRKPYIRYERKHSLSAVHLDWHTSKINGKEVCVVLDDSSRFILAGGEFDAAIGETSIDLVRKVLEDYGEVRKIREVITDHGSQFFANKTDKEGKSESAFDVFLAKNDIKHILAGVKHPRPMEKLRNGIIPTRKVENYLMILTNSWIGTIRFAITRVSMRNTIYRLQKMPFGPECLMSAS